MSKYAILRSSTLRAGDPDASLQGDLPSGRRSHLGFVLRAVVGIAIVTFLVLRYDARSVLQLLAREQPGYFEAAVGVYVSTQMISAYRWRLLAAIVQVEASFTLFLFCAPIAGVFASLPLTVNGLGVREGAYLVLFALAGVGRTDAIALGLLWFVSATLGALPGVIAFVATPTNRSLICRRLM